MTRYRDSYSEPDDDSRYSAGEEWKKDSAYGDASHISHSRSLNLIRLESAADREFARKAKTILQPTDVIIPLTLTTNFESYWQRCPRCQQMFILFCKTLPIYKWMYGQKYKKALQLLMGCTCGFPDTDENGYVK